MYKIAYEKKIKSIENVLINLSLKINSLIKKDLLSPINYINSNAEDKTKKKVYYNQLVNQ